LGLGLTAAAFRSLQRQALLEMNLEFDGQCKNIQRALQTELSSYEHLLLGLRGFFTHSPITRGEFKDYIAGLDLPGEYPAALGVSYAEDVAVPGQQAHRHIVTYLEPQTSGSNILGVDLTSLRPGSRELIEQVRVTGDMVSTAGEGNNVASRLGIYRKGWPVGTTAERRAAFIGSVGLGVSLERLVAQVVSPVVAARIHFSIYDLGQADNPLREVQPSRARLVIESPRVQQDQQADGWLNLTTHETLEFGSRLFELHFDAPASAFSRPMDRTLPIFVAVFGTLTTLLLSALIASLQRSEHRLEQEVDKRTADLQESNRKLLSEIDQRERLEGEILRVAEEERKSLGRDLHDDLGQHLTAVAFLAESLSRDMEQRKSPEGAAQACRIVNHLGAAVSKIRLLAKGLYPLARDEAGADIAFEQLATESREVFSIDCRIMGDTSFSANIPGAAQQLYRIAQEAVRNAVRHGKASAVTVELSRVNGKPRMVIADNGNGFESVNRRSGLGLRIMRSRCHMLGLDLTISRGPSGGTVLCIA
jgi:signal transduction histidine kinase